MRRQRLLIRDHLMIAAAELLLTLAIPATDLGTKLLPAPSLEDGYLRKLFEHATWGFYRHRLKPAGWTVSHGQRLNWQTSNESPGMRTLLPGMQVDIALEAPPDTEHPPRRIVIDTKFASITKVGQFGQQTLASGYVYQIYAYLMSQRGPDQPNKPEGLMLHPSVGQHVDEEVEIQGHRFRFATVDLAADPHTIADGFMSAISPRSVAPSG